ncbi:hypothetical protein GOBAR_DD25754 [Gossypium barbadense]|nr:hypothetical protein GOBAR_DD25754 [Gossypium barbadense]
MTFSSSEWLVFILGSLDSTCKIVADLNLTRDVYIAGKGNFYVLPGVRFHCPILGCSITLNISGNFSLGENSTIVAGTFELAAYNASFFNGSAVNTTGWAGDPPPQTSGTPQGVEGAGGGHGGRGASCLVEEGKLPEDVWGGDAYSWSSLQNPSSYGRGISRGCSKNAGAAGTLYDAVPRSLNVNNYNLSTDTETLLLEFPYQPLWTNVYIRNCARASVPLLWSRVQVQGQISLLCGGVLSFGLAHYATSEFELLAEELLMSDSIIKVYGALRMTVKIFLMWNSKMLIDGGEDSTVATSWLEASNLVVLKESSVIQSNANLGVHGQGLLNLSGSGDKIQAQRLVLSLFYSIHVGPGSVLRGPLEDASSYAITPKLYCELQDCPIELLHPPEDCNVNSSLSFTLQICRVEDITVEGLIKGSVVHFHRARTISVQSSGIISASGMMGSVEHPLSSLSVEGSVRADGEGFAETVWQYKNFLSNVSSIAPGGGSGGTVLLFLHMMTLGESAILSSVGGYGSPKGGGGGGGGRIHFHWSNIPTGDVYQPIARVKGSIHARKLNKIQLSLLTWGTYLCSCAGCIGGVGKGNFLDNGIGSGGGHGGKGGLGCYNSSCVGGGNSYGNSKLPCELGSGSGNESSADSIAGGGIIGGLGRDESGSGENGTVTGKACPKGLYGTFCVFKGEKSIQSNDLTEFTGAFYMNELLEEECPVGTYKNVSGSDSSLCQPCPAWELPHRAIYIAVRGGIAETPCPYKCISDRYHMPNCYTALEELIYTFGGPWLFCLLLVGLLILLALVLSVARMKFVGVDELPGPAPTQHGSQIDHSFPFLESLNEVLETNRVEESQSHVHRMYFMGPNTFSEPWHLPHTPPEEIKEIVYEGAYNMFVDEINAIAAYQWWEGAIYTILSILAYPLAWSWQQWRRRMRLQRLREFVRSEYDHACLRSCRSRALYEGLKVSATSDLMLAYMDFFLGGDEKRTDLPPSLPQRFPMVIIFGGDGSYMAPFSLQNDNILTSLMSQLVPPTTWYRLVAGLNAQLRLVRRGQLRVTFRPVLRWLETHANPALRIYGVFIGLAWFQAAPNGYHQYGLLVSSVEEESEPVSSGNTDGGVQTALLSSVRTTYMQNQSGHLGEDVLLTQGHESSDGFARRRRSYGSLIDTNNLQMLEEKRDMFYLLSFIVHNTKPVGHQDLVGLVISMLLLGDFSLVLLTFLLLYSISLLDVFLVLFILPLGVLLPFPAGINALFSHGPRRSAGLARFYALWNITSLVNVGVAFLCGYIHYKSQSSSCKQIPNLQPWNINMDESEWWIFPAGLVLCKLFQSQLINWHVANLEIQDRSLYSNDFDLFWQS